MTSYLSMAFGAGREQMTDLDHRSVMTKLLAAAGWDAGSIRHKQLEDALDGANLEIVERLPSRTLPRRARYDCTDCRDGEKECACGAPRS